MKQLTEVSETALITIRSRAIESQRAHPLLSDPVGEELFKSLSDVLPEKLRLRIMERRLSPVLTSHISIRARKFDALCREFLKEQRDGVIISLGAGFDTRFWRLGLKKQQYLELDLPAVVKAKKQLLGDRITYRMLEDSVLEEKWIKEVGKVQTEHLLFLAEGLFMYLPKDQVISTLKKIATSFTQSRLVMEVVAEKYTRGFRKKMVENKMRRGAGSRAGDQYQFGIAEASEPETYHSGFKLREEWSYFEDPDVRPPLLKIFRYFKSLSKTQYTLILDIS